MSSTRQKISNPKHQISNKFKYLNPKQNIVKSVLNIEISIAGSILEEAGADPSTFVSTFLRGAHPGGTAKIGPSFPQRFGIDI